MNCCDACKPGRWTADMTAAKCGHPTVRGMMELCNGCAVKRGACEACGRPLKPARGSKPPPTSP